MIHFHTLNNKVINKDLTSYQKEIYEMILNYKIYSSEFDLINMQLAILLINKEKVLKISIYLYVNLDILMILLIAVLIYVHIYFFENIIIKFLNYISMTINFKNNIFKFDEMFSKKLDNLEEIIKLYNGDTLKAVNKISLVLYEILYKIIFHGKVKAE